ncbi:serine/threonine-protein kinase [Actinomadura sp. 7K507]|uniref:serine/threonine-protein kinase n=1 Tax=Actinomadura sp. 7K507 TaxID=2530365 RepID=UPI001048D0B9|nr:serine/threonine-protein kinase [Actinomadura sp. 7K507]TDC82675.1 serine/threonine protein kinase [Actinomadura sp. 7K507]
MIGEAREHGMDDWRLQEFTEDRELGRGAQGRVVLARHTTSGTPVAIKYLVRADARAVAGLQAEARMLGRLTSPYVARLYRFVESEHGAAIVMEAIDGASLKEVLREHGALAPEAALLVLKGSLLGLAAAHAVGVVHRDYKPANVVVRADGLSKLVDFGVAVLSGAGSSAGTPVYMAPEQWRGEPATPATDVYAATCVFVECVTGHRPFAAPDRVALMNQHLTAPVDMGDVPEPLRPLVREGMAKNPGERPESATAFVTLLESAAAAAYGSDWEQRGVRALAVAAVALAALFPLGALTVAPAASGAAGAAGAATAGATGAGGAGGGMGAGTVGASVSKGFLATAAGKGTMAAAGTAVVAATAGGAIYARQDTTEPPPDPVVTMAADDRTLTGDPATIQIQNVRYPTVSGLGDPALERRINAELRGPLDRLIEMAKDGARALPCKGNPVQIGTQTTLGIRGPRLVSVRYFQTSDWCRQADGSPGGEVVTIDLRTGRRLTAADVFRAGTLTAGGVSRLQARVEQRPIRYAREWEDCSPDGRFKRSDFFPQKVPSGPGREIAPPYLSAFFHPAGFRLAHLAGGSGGCENLSFGASYASVRDLMKPEIAAMLPAASPSPERT